MKIYRNIGVLNLTKASLDELESIKELKNIGSLILSKKQQEALGHVSMVNVGDRITLEDGENMAFIMRNGELELKEAMLKDIKEKTYYLVNGRIFLENLSVASAEKIAGISINGQIYGPEASYSKIAHRVKMNGQVITYPDGYELMKTDLHLTEEGLLGFDGEESIAVEKIIALDSIPSDFFKKGKAILYILDEIIATKENLSKLAPFVKNMKEVKKTIVPEGYRYFENLTLTESNLHGFKEARIFVKDELKIEVPFIMMEGKVERIIARTLKVFEKEKDQLHRYLERADEISYINPNAFENYANLVIDEGYLKGKKNLEITNYGVLEFEPSIEPDLLAEGMKKLVNYGKILCSRELKGVILEKTKENYGSVNVPSAEKEVLHEEGTVIENVGALEL